MSFIKLKCNEGHCDYSEGSDLKLYILANFLISDVRCYSPSFMEWAWNDWEISTNSNITFLRKENGKVFLSDLYSEEEEPIELEMKLHQFMQILEDWKEKVCKLMPKEVMIKHENGEFVIETTS